MKWRNNFNLQLVIRLLVLCVTAAVISTLSWKQDLFLLILIIAFLLLQIYLVVHFINQSQRKIAYLFEAVQNEDFSLHLPTQTGVSSVNALHSSLNRLNDMIREAYVKSQSQEKYYQEIIKQAEIGILSYNKRGHIVFANPMIEKLLNHKPLNHINQLKQLDGPPFGPAQGGLFDLFSKMEAFDRKLIQLTNEREKKQIAFKSTAITLNKEELLLVVAQDIQQELDENETTSWIRLIRVLTHEIMNTITPITSISESILKYYKTDEEIVSLEELQQQHIQSTAKGLEVIKEQGADLMDFVQSYRSFLQVPAPDKSIVSAQKMLEKVKLLMSQEPTDFPIDFNTYVQPANLQFFLDEKQVSQVLINLCKNAMQSLAQQKDGRIMVEAGLHQDGSKFISVSDNGPGIKPDLRDEIFVPFFTTKKSGTGIGLSLSKQIMHLHGGQLKMHSVPEEETSFMLCF